MAHPPRGYFFLKALKESLPLNRRIYQEKAGLCPSFIDLAAISPFN